MGNMQPKQVYIVRHGNTFDKGDVVTRVGARTDLPLSTSGRLQAQALGAHFKNISFGAVYSSPLLRTLQTAETIIASQPHKLSLQITDFLREIDYGLDENKPESDVIARLGQAALKEWDDAALVPAGWSVDVEAIIASWVGFLDSLAQSPERDPVLVVTSNGVARFLFDAVSEPLSKGIQRKLATAAFGRITLIEGRSTIESWNLRA